MEKRFTLKQWRKLKDMSQSELAEVVGRTDTTIRNWEHGVTHPTATDIAKIEKALDINWSTDILLP